MSEDEEQQESDEHAADDRQESEPRALRVDAHDRLEVLGQGEHHAEQPEHAERSQDHAPGEGARAEEREVDERLQARPPDEPVLPEHKDNEDGQAGRRPGHGAHAAPAGGARLHHAVHEGDQTRAGKDQLLDLALDEVLGEVPLDDDPTLPWQQRAAHFAGLLRSVLMRHRGVAQLAGARVTLGPNALAGVDTLVGLLRSAGFEGARLGLAFSAVLDFVSGSAVMDSRAVTGSDTESLSYEELRGKSVEMLRAVPAEQYPNLASTVEDIVGPNPDERFEYALQALLDGLAVDLERARSGAPRRQAVKRRTQPADLELNRGLAT